MKFSFEKYDNLISNTETVRVNGRVIQVSGLLIEATGPQNPVGDVCNIMTANGPLPCEIVGFREKSIILMPLISTDGIRQGSEVVPIGAPLTAPAGDELLGRLLDGLGNPIDGKGDFSRCSRKRYRLSSGEVRR